MAAHVSQLLARLRRDPFADLPIADQLNQLLRPTFRLTDKESAIRDHRLLARGLNAGPGAATGKIVLHAAMRQS